MHAIDGERRRAKRAGAKARRRPACGRYDSSAHMICASGASYAANSAQNSAAVWGAATAGHGAASASAMPCRMLARRVRAGAGVGAGVSVCVWICVWICVCVDAGTDVDVDVGAGVRVLLATGTDEHGQKVQRAAAQDGNTPQAMCDRVSETFRVSATARLHISKGESEAVIES